MVPFAVVPSLQSTEGGESSLRLPEPPIQRHLLELVDLSPGRVGEPTLGRAGIAVSPARNDRSGHRRAQPAAAGEKSPDGSRTPTGLGIEAPYREGNGDRPVGSSEHRQSHSQVRS